MKNQQFILLIHFTYSVPSSYTISLLFLAIFLLFSFVLFSRDKKGKILTGIKISGLIVNQEGVVMIIDTHTHIGNIFNFSVSKQDLLNSMNRYHIRYSLVSSLEGAEYGHNQVQVPPAEIRSQIKINQDVIDFAHIYPDRIGALLWVMPHTGGATREFERLIQENRDVVFGLKFHPYHNKMNFDSPATEEYLALARKFRLPVVTHTADGESSPARVAVMAQKYPDLSFLMVHMGLGSDNEESIELISRYPNLYGDTTWVRPENALKMMERCGIDKLMFGTDSPIDGIDTYANPIYQTYLHDWESRIGKENYDKLVMKNAIRFFHLSVKEGSNS